MIRLFARRYGASPAHLAGHLALFALAFWAISTMLDMRAAGNWVLWLVAAAILHDLLLLPLYAVPDRLAAGCWPAGERRACPSSTTCACPWPCPARCCS
jgi:hypothetical protein